MQLHSTPLHFATGRFRPDDHSQELVYSIMKTLIEAGVDPTATNSVSLFMPSYDIYTNKSGNKSLKMRTLQVTLALLFTCYKILLTLTASCARAWAPFILSGWSTQILNCSRDHRHR